MLLQLVSALMPTTRRKAGEVYRRTSSGYVIADVLTTNHLPAALFHVACYNLTASFSYDKRYTPRAAVAFYSPSRSNGGPAYRIQLIPTICQGRNKATVACLAKLT